MNYIKFFLIILLSSCAKYHGIDLEGFKQVENSKLVIEKLYKENFSMKHSVTLSYLGEDRRFEQVFTCYEKVYAKETVCRVSWFTPSYLTTLYTAVGSANESVAVDQVNKIFFTSNDPNVLLLPEFFNIKIYFSVFKKVLLGFTEKDFSKDENIKIYESEEDKVNILETTDFVSGTISRILYDPKTKEITKASISNSSSSLLFEVISRDKNSYPSVVWLSSSDSRVKFIFNKNSILESDGVVTDVDLSLKIPPGFREIKLNSNK